jgi:WD40 repeat-containing protein SMU1
MDEAITIPASDILSLIQCHLIESGLHSTSSCLATESTQKCPGLTPSSKSTLICAAIDGRWGEVLTMLDMVDVERYRRCIIDDLVYRHRRKNAERRKADTDNKVEGDHVADGDDDDDERQKLTSTMITQLEKAIAMSHEMAILELAEIGEFELAYAALRLSTGMLNRTLRNENDDDDEVDYNYHNHNNNNEASGATTAYSRSSDVEWRITNLISIRRSHDGENNDHSSSSSSSSTLLPPDYYGSTSKQKRRDRIAKLLRQCVPEIPTRRLISLLQQSIKWQSHTGTIPSVKRLFQHEDEEGIVDEEIIDEVVGDNEKDGMSKKKKKKRKKHDVEQKFDLVLGNVAIGNMGHGKDKRHDGTNIVTERIPSRVHQTIRLGKKSYVECAIFLPDGKGLITGSSDGFIEVWGEPPSINGDGDSSTIVAANILNFDKLRTSDLPYQLNDQLMMHDSSVLAMDVSNDGTLLGTASSNGTVCVWKISDGKLLRKFERAHGGLDGGDKGAAVTCIQFLPDGSKVLTGGQDSTCREFGLLNSRMLKEFRGHKSYVNCCSYVILPPSVLGNGGSRSSFLAVVTGSADGSVIIWDGRTAEAMKEINPPIPTSINAVTVGSNSIHTVIHLHSPPNTMIVVPRSDHAYLMSYSGALLRVFTRDDVQGSEFLAATISPSNQWLYVAASDGKCVVCLT